MSQAPRQPSVICECKVCKKQFTAQANVVQKGGGKFCSVACFAISKTTAVMRECLNCKKKFPVSKSKAASEKYIYCSRACRNGHTRKSEDRNCERCAADFIFYPNGRDAKWGRWCSKKCKGLSTRDENSPAYKGGGLINEHNMRRIQVDDHEHKDKRKPQLEHRAIAERAIGRPLHRGEVIIHQNGDNAVNDELNLFICGGGAGEMTKRHKGVLPWPKEGNLSTYR